MEEPVKSMSTSQKATIVPAFRCMLGSDVNVSTNSHLEILIESIPKKKQGRIFELLTWNLLFIVYCFVCQKLYKSNKI